jgi:hypothetical protein
MSSHDSEKASESDKSLTSLPGSIADMRSAELPAPVTDESSATLPVGSNVPKLNRKKIDSIKRHARQFFNKIVDGLKAGDQKILLSLIVVFISILALIHTGGRSDISLERRIGYVCAIAGAFIAVFGLVISESRAANQKVWKIVVFILGLALVIVGLWVVIKLSP